MKKTLGRIAGLCCLSVLSFGSTIDQISFSDGSVHTVAVNAWDVFGNNMGPMLITVNFGLGSASCNWVAATAGCSVANQFAVGYSPASGQTYPVLQPDGYWYITDLRPSAAGTDNNIFSASFNTLVGSVALDRCMSDSAFNDNNESLGADCTSGEGTINSSNGWTANDAPGGGHIVADVAYTNRLRTETQNVGDLYGFMTLTFNKDETHFAPDGQFTWWMDTDAVTAPEPATLGLVGGVLLALGVVRRKKRK